MVRILITAKIVLVLFLASCKSSARKEDNSVADSGLVEFLENPEADTRLENRKFEQVPTVVASEDGKTLFVGWYSGGEAPGPGNYVTVSTSEDNGASWNANRLVVYPRQGSVRVFDPMLWRDAKGKVMLTYGTAGDSLIWDGFGGVNTVEIEATAAGIKGKSPIRLADGVMSNKPVYLASQDLLLVPVYIDKPAGTPVAGRQYPKDGAFVFSKDKAGKIAAYSSIALPDSIRIHDEPQLVQLTDSGEFLAMLRTTKGIYSAESKDFGKTWSVPKPFTASGPTTSSRFYIGKLASGNLLLISNNSTTRNNMMASVSRDKGKTWPFQLMLDARDNVSYPDADQTPDGNIHVVFDRDRTGARDILYTRFSEDDILKGNQSGIFKVRVNP